MYSRASSLRSPLELWWRLLLSCRNRASGFLLSPVQKRTPASSSGQILGLVLGELLSSSPPASGLVVPSELLPPEPVLYKYLLHPLFPSVLFQDPVWCATLAIVLSS